MNIQHVINNVVANVFFVDDASTLSGGVLTTPTGAFPAPSDGESYMNQSGAGIGWTLSAGVLSAPVVTPPVLSKEELIAFANKFQWSLATGGHNVTIGGTTYLFSTDPTSQSLITGKALRLQLSGAPTSVDWQFADSFTTFAAADFLTAAENVADWVQSTFDALRPVIAAIVAGTITTTAEIDAATWPTP